MSRCHADGNGLSRGRAEQLRVLGFVALRSTVVKVELVSSSLMRDEDWIFPVPSREAGKPVNEHQERRTGD